MDSVDPSASQPRDGLHPVLEVRLAHAPHYKDLIARSHPAGPAISATATAGPRWNRQTWIPSANRPWLEIRVTPVKWIPPKRDLSVIMARRHIRPSRGPGLNTPTGRSGSPVRRPTTRAIVKGWRSPSSCASRRSPARRFGCRTGRAPSDRLCQSGSLPAPPTPVSLATPPLPLTHRQPSVTLSMFWERFTIHYIGTNADHRQEDAP